MRGVSLAHFRVCGGKSYVVEGASVVIDRNLGLLTVRQYHGRKVYTLPLWKVADFVVYHITKQELAERAREKKAKKRGR